MNEKITWRYTPTAIALHWLLALLLTAMAGVGWYMMSIEHEPGADRLFDLHKSAGLLVGLLVVVRVGVRLLNKPQPLPVSVAPWQVKLSLVTQFGLYLLMLLMPLTGYIGASYSKSGVPFFGLATPRWAAPDHDTAEQYFDIHSILIWVMVALVALHVLGALKHLLMDKDGVFQRMRLPPA
jgi:cytochrome b561